MPYACVIWELIEPDPEFFNTICTRGDSRAAARAVKVFDREATKLALSHLRTHSSDDAPAYEKVPGGFIPTLPWPHSCLLPTELQQLLDLLHEFRDRFNDGSEALPATSLLKALLDTGDAQPIFTPPRRLSPGHEASGPRRSPQARRPVDHGAQHGMLEYPDSQAPRLSGAWRLSCDYCAINKPVCVPQQALPRTDDIVASCRGKKYLSILDVCKGFYQIEIVEEDGPKTSFVTPDCQRQCAVVC
ncbi:hypothetical protein Emag_006888 [Eimeria magna]